MSFDSELLEIIEGTNLYYATIARRYSVLHTADIVGEFLSQYFPHYTQYISSEKFLWSAQVIASRSFTSMLLQPGSCLDPLHPDHQPQTPQKTSLIPCLVPLFDLFNHHPAAQVMWKTTSTYVQLVGNAKKQHFSVSLEIYNNYGPIGNESLMLSYGFALEENPYNDFHVILSISENHSRMISMLEQLGMKTDRGIRLTFSSPALESSIEKLLFAVSISLHGVPYPFPIHNTLGKQATLCAVTAQESTPLFVAHTTLNHVLVLLVTRIYKYRQMLDKLSSMISENSHLGDTPVSHQIKMLAIYISGQHDLLCKAQQVVYQTYLRYLASVVTKAYSFTSLKLLHTRIQPISTSESRCAGAVVVPLLPALVLTEVIHRSALLNALVDQGIDLEPEYLFALFLLSLQAKSNSSLSQFCCSTQRDHEQCRCNDACCPNIVDQQIHINRLGTIQEKRLVNDESLVASHPKRSKCEIKEVNEAIFTISALSAQSDLISTSEPNKDEPVTRISKTLDLNEDTIEMLQQAQNDDLAVLADLTPLLLSFPELYEDGHPLPCTWLAMLRCVRRRLVDAHTTLSPLKTSVALSPQKVSAQESSSPPATPYHMNSFQSEQQLVHVLLPSDFYFVRGLAANVFARLADVNSDLSTTVDLVALSDFQRGDKVVLSVPNFALSTISLQMCTALQAAYS
eukprot:gene300-3670_t